MRLFALVVSLYLPLVVWAGEHPQGHEHPKGQEHPAAPKEQAHEHPKKEHPAKEHPHGAMDIQKAFTGVVNAYIKDQYKVGGGAFVVSDESTGKARSLMLSRIHKNKIVKLSENEAFACADFKTVKGGKDDLDLDFYVAKSANGWRVSKVLIHKVNAKPRFTYDNANRMVPVQ